MRAIGNTTKTITATPRQLESMIRISEALAKMRLSDHVEKVDVEEAVKLIKNALQQSATDPTTGKINMDIITTGQTKTNADKLKAIMDFIKGIQDNFRDRINSQGIKYLNLYDFLVNKVKEGQVTQLNASGDNTVTEKEFREALMHLEDDGVIYLYGHSTAPTIRFANN